MGSLGSWSCSLSHSRGLAGLGLTATPPVSPRGTAPSCAESSPSFLAPGHRAVSWEPTSQQRQTEAGSGLSFHLSQHSSGDSTGRVCTLSQPSIWTLPFTGNSERTLSSKLWSCRDVVGQEQDDQPPGLRHVNYMPSASYPKTCLNPCMVLSLTDSLITQSHRQADGPRSSSMTKVTLGRQEASRSIGGQRHALRDPGYTRHFWRQPRMGHRLWERKLAAPAPRDSWSLPGRSCEPRAMPARQRD